LDKLEVELKEIDRIGKKIINFYSLKCK
jgi:hypothetical protein